MRKTINYINVIIVLSTMGSIFFLSSQSGEISNELSHKVMSGFKGYVSSATWIGTDIKNIFLSNPMICTRKLAHIIIYCILGAAIYILLPENWRLKKRILVCISSCVLYAITDEIHQMFVEGRTAQLIDIVIDFIGSSIGLYMGWICNKIHMTLSRI